ncbi:Protein phosphatase 2C 6 [Coemansia erecta]|uniref:Protein phosphatase 2C 6 n=1 Tax=Coemansia erecta TaxID=147472 RepID=A0A9W7XYG4_9FUNG|nr:Protein phosphatase 2C 6 [Coemansia erecta]
MAAAVAAASPSASSQPGKAEAGAKAYPYYVAYTEEGTVRVDVRKSPQLVGLTSSRGTRGSNQDRAEFRPLRIPGMVADRRDKSSAQVMYVGVYDGHGGDACAEYLRQVLAARIEAAAVDDLAAVLSTLRQFGRDWAGYTPAALQRLEEAAVQRREAPSFLTLDERLTLAFLSADGAASNLRWSDGQGSTACTLLLWDGEGQPFWARTSQLHVAVANVGDSKAILCRASGLAEALSSPHHPGVRGERERLQRHGAFFSRDSFGEERAMARVANTRAFGDWQVKRFGVVAEPELRHVDVAGDDAAFVAVVSDGLTSVLTDQEIVDVAKGCATPEQAARRLVDVAERLGSDDNMTAVVLRLPAWDAPMSDLTHDLRERRLESVERVRRLRGSMLLGPHGSASLQETQSSAAAATAAAVAANVRLATPERLLRRIFTTHQRPLLSVAQILRRVRASGFRLTLVAEPSELVLDSDEDSGSVVAAPEVLRMTLAVLGRAAARPPPQPDCALTHEQERETLSLDDVERAWRLIGLHVIEA